MPWRFTKMAPKFERPNSRCTRATPKLLAGAMRAPVRGLTASSVCMSITPTL